MTTHDPKTFVPHTLPQLFILFNEFEHYQYAELERNYQTLKVYGSDKVKRSYYNIAQNRMVMSLTYRYIPTLFTRKLLKKE